MPSSSTAQFFSHYQEDPFVNMAFDEWMLQNVIRTPALFLARLYTWQIGAITFGVNQRQESALDFRNVGSTPVIRRITGGRALYHDLSEVTYSVALNNADRDHRPGAFGSSRSDLNASIVRGLSTFLASIGIETNMVRKSSPQNSRPEFFHKAACFASSAKYEMMSREGKVVASAQRRVVDCLLQHGSIKLAGVALHPALHLTKGHPETSLKPVDRIRFAKLSELFRIALGQAFQIPLNQTITASTSSLEIGAHASHIREFPMSTRETFAQTPAQISL